MRTVRLVVALLLTIGAVVPRQAEAQSGPLLVEGHVGGAWFIDERFINHLALGAGARRYLTPSVAAGPEVTFMRGPGIDRDWSVTGNVSWDLRKPGQVVTPYVIAGGGMTRTQLAVGTGPYVSTEGAVFGGAGIRIAPTGRWFIAPEFRMGWEPLWRFGVSIGMR